MNIHITIYNKETGKIRGITVCNEDSKLNQCLDSEWFIEGSFDPFTHYMDVEKNEVRAMPPSPSENHIFDYNTKDWIDPRTLDDHKSAKWKEIKRQRDVAEFTTFTYNNMEFDGDLDAQRRLAAYISVSKSSIAAGQPFEAEFTLANNINVTLTAQDFVGIELAMVQAVAATFNHASALRAQIDAATTVQEVESITW